MEAQIVWLVRKQFLAQTPKKGDGGPDITSRTLNSNELSNGKDRTQSDSRKRNRESDSQEPLRIVAVERVHPFRFAGYRRSGRVGRIGDLWIWFLENLRKTS